MNETIADRLWRLEPVRVRTPAGKEFTITARYFAGARGFSTGRGKPHVLMTRKRLETWTDQLTEVTT